MFSKEVLEKVRRLQSARLSLMKKQPFFAVLLLYMQFALDPMCETAYTDGARIAFCPDFIDSISDRELEFVLMHEVLHAALNHCGRAVESYEFDDFATACDIVVNSNILSASGMDQSAITLEKYGVAMHLAPDGTEGFEHTAEDVYRMIRAMAAVCKTGKDQNGRNGAAPDAVRKDGGFDDHTFWGGETGEDGENDGNGTGAENDVESREDAVSEMRDVWLHRMVEATQIAEHISARNGTGCDSAPAGIKRLLKELTEPQTDWRTVLDMFIQEEVTDYSFNPPDRRMQDSPFLLPDYNDTELTAKDILFMIDTSGSMSDDMITQAYSEIRGAIEQFGGRLSGWLGFFDARVIEPKKFTSEEEFRIIRPEGGGGTSFHCVFNYVRDHLSADFEPVSIIILTDGVAAFPDEKDALGIPVLWIINNEEVTPPWGKTTRIRVKGLGQK